MLERCCGPDLDDEAFAAEDSGGLRLQNLEGDLAVVPDVVGQVHGGHAALAQLALDAVAVGQRRAQPIQRIAQGDSGVERDP